MKQIELQCETTADEDFLRRLYASTRQPEMAQVPWSELQKQQFLNQQFNLQRQHYQTQYSNISFAIVLLAGKPVGRWYVQRGATEYRVVDISLLPEFCNQGIGSHLLSHLLQEANLAGKPVTLHVDRFSRAKNLYLKLGFRNVEDKGMHILMAWHPHGC